MQSNSGPAAIRWLFDEIELRAKADEIRLRAKAYEIGFELDAIQLGPCRHQVAFR